MKQVVFGKTIQGAAHIRNNVECQDSHECRILDDGTIVMAVADGHGSSNCPYSSIGANTAVSLFCNIMTKIHNEYSDPEQIPTIDISKAIEQEWKKHIRQTHKTTIKKHRNLFKTRMNLDLIYHLYGTTLLGMMITKNYFFGLQLGDGDICYVNQKGLRKVVLHVYLGKREKKGLQKEHRRLLIVAATQTRRKSSYAPRRRYRN